MQSYQKDLIQKLLKTQVDEWNLYSNKEVKECIKNEKPEIKKG